MTIHKCDRCGCERRENETLTEVGCRTKTLTSGFTYLPMGEFCKVCWNRIENQITPMTAEEVMARYSLLDKKEQQKFDVRYRELLKFRKTVRQLEKLSPDQLDTFVKRFNK